MEIKLENGRYKPAKYAGLETVSAGEELAQRILMRLTAHRGGFAPLPDYGSKLYTLPAIKPADRLGAAKMFIAQALSDEPGVELTDMSMEETGGVIMLKLSFETAAGALSLNTEIGGAG